MAHWESHYLPPDPLVWQGRVDFPPDSCFYQHIQLQNLLNELPAQATQTTFALLGFRCDEGVQRDLGRAGAVEGPKAIRQQLANLAIQQPDVEVLDIGDITCESHDLEAAQLALAEVTALLFERNITAILLGGGHELAFGHYQGITQVYPPEKRLGIINFDAHFDMLPLQNSQSGSASTTFQQIANHHHNHKRHFDYNCIGIQHAGNTRLAFEVAKKQQTKFILADALHEGFQEKSFDFIDRVVDQNDIVYVSLSLDVFSPGYAPGVSNIQPLGLNPWHVIPLLRQIAASGKVLGYDIAEHVPRYDIDHRTAKLAAMLIYEIIHHHQQKHH